MNLETGRCIHGYKFQELAMPDHVIDRVHELADTKGAVDLDKDRCPIFEWEIGALGRNPDELVDINEYDEATVDDESGLSSRDESEDDDNSSNE